MFFGGGGFDFQVQKRTLQQGHYVVVPAVPTAPAAQAVEGRAGKFLAKDLGHEPLESGPEARRGRVAEAVLGIPQGLSQSQFHQHMNVLSARIRG